MKDYDTVKDIPIFYGYGTEDPYLKEWMVDWWLDSLKNITKNVEAKQYPCMGHKCSDVVRIYFILL